MTYQFPLDCSRLCSVRAAVVEGAKTYDRMEPRTVQLYEATQHACFELPAPPGPCVAEVREAWKPIRRAMNLFFYALVAAETSLGVAETSVRFGRTPDLARLFAVARALLDAAIEAERAFDQIGRQSVPPGGAP